MTILAIELRMVSTQNVQVTDDTLIVDLAMGEWCPCRWRGFRVFCMGLQMNATSGD